jgi:hypothetical protein
MRYLSSSSAQIIFLFASLFFANQAWAQVAISTQSSTTAPDPTAVLLLVGDGSQGLIIPIVTNKSAASQKKGMVVFDDSDKKVYFNNGSGWIEVGGGSGSGVKGIRIQGNVVTVDNTSPASFSLAQTAPTVNGQLLMWDATLNSTAGGWTSSKNTAPANGQVLKWNGTSWEPGPDNIGSTPTLPNNQIFVGNASNVATSVLMSQDATINNTGALTIATGAINSTKILDGTIADADVSTSAAIAGSKIDPNFTIGLAAPSLKLTGGGTSINGQAYTWPAVAPLANTFLQSDALGNLSWASSGGGFSIPGAVPKGSVGGLVASTITDTGSTVEITANSPKLSLKSTSAVSTAAASSLEFTNAINGLIGSISDTGSSDHLQISSFQQGLLFNTNFNTRMAVDNNGNVGIGTISPVSKLDVSGDLHLSQITAPSPTSDKLYNLGGNLFWNGTNISSGGGGGWSLTGNAGTNPATNFIGTTDAQPLIIRNSGVESMRINTSYVSMGGRTTPVNANSFFDIQTDNGSGLGGMYVDVADPDGDAFYGYSNLGTSRALTYMDATTGSWFVQTAGSDRLSITSGGNVGIGSNSPQEKLTLFNTSDAGLAVNSYGSFGGAASTARIVLQGATGLFIAPGMSREWTIGTSSTTSNNLDISARTASNVLPAREFTFSPTAFFAATDNNNSLGLSSNRWTTVFAVNGTINTSDARLKENVQNINYGLSEVMRLRPVSYNWKTGAKYTKLGLIAQETEKIIPEVVSKPQEKDGYYGIMYSDLIPVLIKAIQEQQKTIDTLSEQNKALKEKELKFEASLVKQEGEMTALKKQMEEVLRIVGAEAKKK